MQQEKKPNELLKCFFVSNSKFEMNKSIQKNFRFEVSFDQAFEGELHRQGIFIQPYHMLSVDVPVSYGFKAEVMKIGPYSYGFPTMEHSGFELSIIFEEDENATIGKFIHYLQSKIIRDVDSGANGNYNPQSMNRIAEITINQFNDLGNINRTIHFMDAFFTNATSMSLNYDGNESVKHTITFHSDFMSQEFPMLKSASNSVPDAVNMNVPSTGIESA